MSLFVFVIKGLVVPGGGAERVFVDLANAFAARGHEVHVATFDHAGVPFFYKLDPAIPVHFLKIAAPGIPTPPSSMPKIMFRLRKLAKDIRPDAVVAFMHSTYIPTALGLLGTGIPVIASEHTVGAHFETRPVERTLTRLVQRFSYAKTVVSSLVRAEHPVAYHSNLVVLPNPVVMDEFKSAQSLKPEKLILCVGGLRVEKGQGDLIAAFERIAPDHPEWRLRFVGDGVTRPQIEQQIGASPYAERIELPGVLRDVPSEYAKAAFVVVPSLYESLSMTAIEAMASGRAVIGFSDCAGPTALITDGTNGLLVDPGADRAAALAKAMDQLIRNGDDRERMGTNAPASVESYSADAVVGQWEALLRSASQNAPIPKNLAVQ